MIRVAAFAEGDPVAIYRHDYAPMKAKALGKLKMTIKNALKLRYEK